MDSNIYDSPNSESNSSDTHESIKKPKGVWLVALWMLFHFGIVIYGSSLIASRMVQYDYMTVKIITVAAFLVLCILAFGVVKPVTIIVNLTAFIFIAYGAYQVYLLIITLFNSPQIIPVYRVFVGIIPSFICAWYLLSPSIRNYLNSISLIKANA